MLNLILVPVDRSLLAEYILPHVVAVAKAFGSEVMLLHVLDPAASNAEGRSIDLWSWQIQQMEAEAYLQKLASRFEEAGLQVRTNLLEGNSPENIIRSSYPLDSNLILLSSHGQGGLNDWTVNSVGSKIIQMARTSVMIVPSHQPPEHTLIDWHYRRILVPLDGSRRAEFGLSVAVQLAHAHQAELLLAHVVKPPEMSGGRQLTAQDQALQQQIVESNRAEAVQYLENLEHSLELNVKSCLLVSNNVAETLHTLVDQERIDLVVLSAHGLSGNPQRPYGNVAANFLANSSVPLLVAQDFNEEGIESTQAESLAE